MINDTRNGPCKVNELESEPEPEMNEREQTKRPARQAAVKFKKLIQEKKHLL